MVIMIIDIVGVLRDFQPAFPPESSFIDQPLEHRYENPVSVLADGRDLAHPGVQF
jgi:hypothetical protein